MTYDFKKHSPVVVVATVLMAIAHNLLTGTSIWQSVVFSLSLIAFLRIVYYIKKCIGGKDSLISFFEIGSASRITVVIFPVIFGLLAWLAAGLWFVVIAAAAIGFVIELLMNFRFADKRGG